MEKRVRDLHCKRSIGRLLINSEETKSLKINAKSERRFKMNENCTEEVNKFLYLGSVVTKNGGTEKV
jgi:hypothetical protein